RQRPVVRTHDSDAGLCALFLLRGLLNLVDEFERATRGVRVNIDVTFVVIIVIEEVEIDALGGGKEHRSQQNQARESKLAIVELVDRLNRKAAGEREWNEEV